MTFYTVAYMLLTVGIVGYVISDLFRALAWRVIRPDKLSEWSIEIGCLGILLAVCTAWVQLGRFLWSR